MSMYKMHKFIGLFSPQFSTKPWENPKNHRQAERNNRKSMATVTHRTDRITKNEWIQKCLKTYIASIHKQHPRRGGAGGIALPVLLKVHFQENFFPMDKRGLISGFLMQEYKFTP